MLDELDILFCCGRLDLLSFFTPKRWGCSVDPRLIKFGHKFGAISDNFLAWSQIFTNATR